MYNVGFFLKVQNVDGDDMQGSAVGIATRLRAGRRWIYGSFVGRAKSPRPALGPTKPSTEWVIVALSLVVQGRSVKLTTHPHLMTRLKMSGSVTSLIHTSPFLFL